jgi:two-component system, OmpR family, response regulator
MSQKPTTAQPPLNARVLIVDDERNLVRLVHTNLTSVGCTVVDAGDGKSAIAALEGQQFDLVILDIMLPDMNGWQV